MPDSFIDYRMRIFIRTKGRDNLTTSELMQGSPVVHPYHPFGQDSYVDMMVKGEGIYLYDQAGKQYIDGISGLWNIPLGYRQPAVIDAIRSQMEQLPFVNMLENTSPVTVAFAKALMRLVDPSFTKLVYTSSGSESIEVAIKIARKYHRMTKSYKNKLLVFDHSYHGTFYGSMSASGLDREEARNFQPTVPGFLFITDFFEDFQYKQDEGIERQISKLRDMFETYGDELAGVIVEPVLGSAGVLPVPINYLKVLKQCCQQYDVLMIFDEIATGFGRTGYLFSYEEYGIVPDILCLAKGINNGYLPLGTVLLNRKIASVFEQTHSIFEHLSTQNGNPLACAAGLKTIELLSEHRYVYKVRQDGEWMLRALEDALSACPLVSDIRGKGLMISVSLTIPGKQGEQGHALSRSQLYSLSWFIKNNGLIVYPHYAPPYSTGICLLPPYIANQEQLTTIVRIIAQSVREFSRELTVHG